MKKINAILIKQDEPKMKRIRIQGTLEELQGLVGGWIEQLPYCDPKWTNDVAFYGNETIKLSPHHVNYVANAIISNSIPGGLSGDYIAGDVVIVGIGQDGECVSLPEAFIT